VGLHRRVQDLLNIQEEIGVVEAVEPQDMQEMADKVHQHAHFLPFLAHQVQAVAVVVAGLRKIIIFVIARVQAVAVLD
jgi:hypothetical protein